LKYGILKQKIIISGIFNYVKVLQVFLFNATDNNISVVAWCSVLLVKEIGVPGEIH
jgi:hypothetical protein